MLVDQYSGSSLLNSQGKSESASDPENSTLRKVAACIPILGLFIGLIQSDSIKEKLQKLPLPKEFRPHPLMGNVLSETASSDEKKSACRRAIQLESIERDYTKAALVNVVLMIALVICGVALNLFPLIPGIIVVGLYSLPAITFAVILRSSSMIECYEHVINKYK